MREAFTQGSAAFECGLLDKGTGDVRTILWRARSIGAVGHLTLLAIGLDITEARVAEIKNRESEERFRLQADQYATMLATTADGFCILDPQSRFVEVNDAFCLMTGYAREELLKIGLQDIQAGEAPEEKGRHVARILADGFDRFESRHRRKDGVVADVEVSISFWRNGARFLCFVRDITEGKRAAETIRLQADQYATMLATAVSGFYAVDTGGRFVEVNDAYCHLSGYSREELLTLRINDVEASESVEATKAHMARIMAKGFDHFESQHRRKDGLIIDVEGGVSFWRSGGRFLAFVRDITDRKRAEEALQHSQERLVLATQSARMGIWVYDVPANKLIWDKRMFELYGIREPDFSGAYDAWQAGLHPDDRASGDAAINASIAEVKDFSIEFRVVWPNGEIHDIEAHAVAQGPAQGPATRMIGVNWDITDRKKAEHALADSELRLKTVLDTNVDGIGLMDLETNKVVFANRAFAELLGRSVDEMTEIGLDDCYPREALPEIRRAIERQLKGEVRVSPNLPLKRKDGSIVLTDIAASPLVLDGRRYMVGCFHDVTERKAAEEKLSTMARYDLLTGLANRGVFVDALDRAIALARRGAGGFAVLYLDLDHFKDVNDTLGHPVGDLLIQAVADRLRSVIRASDTAARFGGDEFGVLLPDIDDPAHVAVIADRVKEALAEIFAVEQTAAAAGAVADKVLHTVGEPFSVQGNDIRTGASIGIAVYGGDSSDAETTLSHADVALHRAKSDGRGGYRFFDPAMEVEVRARVALGIELREAIAAGQLFLMYQPQVELATGRIVGLEALVRWNHPARGLVGPGHFIPEAERNGLIVPLGHWVLVEACRQASRWRKAGIAPPRVSVNLSGVQFKRPLEPEKDIAAILRETGLPPQSLELELTESVLMDASARHNDLLLRFRAAGYRIAIDDFGSGYSSLDYLRRYPVDRIKIAQSFIADIGQVSGNDAIVRAALGLARELDIEVVVEGVETLAQLDLLKSWGCRIVQGFYFSRPRPVPETTALLRAGKIAVPADAASPAPSVAA